MKTVALIGCGFVADLYMRSFALHPEVQIAGVYDADTARRAAFCTYWGLRAHDSAASLFDALPEGALILNLTNPAAHYQVSKSALDAGFHVFSEKPLTVDMDSAHDLYRLADARGLLLGSAPSSVLGEAAQTVGWALREGVAGQVRLIYAELDDGFIRQAPFRDWKSESGAPWPAADEFATGCTLEHAGYYLSWLIAWFGTVTKVAGVAANLAGEAGDAPDFANASITFDNGVVVRLTASIVASHDHGLRVFGDKGVLKLAEAWDNATPVKFHRRYTLRRRLIEHPIGKRIRLSGPTHPKVKRFGAAAMNFALGPVEMLAALAEGRRSRLNADFALHLNEVTQAVQTGGVHEMTTRCPPMEPMPWAK